MSEYFIFICILFYMSLKHNNQPPVCIIKFLEVFITNLPENLLYSWSSFSCSSHSQDLKFSGSLLLLFLFLIALWDLEFVIFVHVTLTASLSSNFKTYHIVKRKLKHPAQRMLNRFIPHKEGKSKGFLEFYLFLLFPSYVSK